MSGIELDDIHRVRLLAGDTAVLNQWWLRSNSLERRTALLEVDRSRVLIEENGWSGNA